MTNTINMASVFAALDQRKADALATIAKYSEADQIEAARVAQIYDRCDKTSIKHYSNVAAYLVANFNTL